MPASQLSKSAQDLLRRALEDSETVEVERDGEVIAAIVSRERLEELEAAESGALFTALVERAIAEAGGEISEEEAVRLSKATRRERYEAGRAAH